MVTNRPFERRQNHQNPSNILVNIRSIRGHVLISVHFWIMLESRVMHVVVPNWEGMRPHQGGQAGKAHPLTADRSYEEDTHGESHQSLGLSIRSEFNSFVSAKKTG